MGFFNPVRTISSEFSSVYKQTGFSSRLKIEDNTLSLRLFRKPERSPEPAIFPAFSPGIARLYRQQLQALQFVWRKLFFCPECLPGDFTQFLIEILLQGTYPMCQSVFPFST